MATRSKTIEYAFATRTTILADATRHDFTAITVYIPENTSRTFKSATIEIHARDANTATTSRASLSAWLIGIKLGATAFSDNTLSATWTDSGEHISYQFDRDVVSYFNTNFGSGTSQTCQVGFQFTTSSATNPVTLINITAKLILTYEFDDSGQTTRVKTVRIPIESRASVLTPASTLVEIGTNQVPLLDTFLPEASKTYRNIFFEIMFNESAAATTDITPGFALDAEAAVTFGALEQANNSSCWNKLIWVRDDMSTSSTHAFKAQSSVNNTLCFVGGVLVVTYEYNHSTTTSVINSVIVGSEVQSQFWSFFQTASADAERSRQCFLVNEPGTITLKQSGFIFYFTSISNTTVNFRCGAQSYRAYTGTMGSVTCGQFTAVHRVDSGGAAGSAGITLAGGINDFFYDAYVSASNIAGTFGGYYIINYTSDVASSGADVHNHTLFMLNQTMNSYTQYHTVTPTPVSIPESSYYCNNVFHRISLTNASQNGAFIYRIEKLSSDNLTNSAGWDVIFLDQTSSDPEFQYMYLFSDFTKLVQKYPDTTSKGINIETSSRRFSDWSGGNSFKNIYSYTTYSAITYAVAGTVSGYTGDGSGLTVKVYKTTGEYLGSATTSAGGTYSFTWYDKAVNVYTACRQSSSLKGRSDDGVAGTDTFNISLAGGGGESFSAYTT